MRSLMFVAGVREGSLGKEKRNVFSNLDIIRGIASLAVVVWHAEILFGFRPISGYLAVDLFFVLSGVVITKSYDDRISAGMSFVSFSLVRIIRLYPTYVMALALSFCAIAAGLVLGLPSKWEMSNLVVAFFLSSAFLPVFGKFSSNGTIFPLNTPSWSLFFELLSNFTYMRFHASLRGRGGAILLALFAAWLIVSVAIFGDLNRGFRASDWWAGIPRVGYSFGIGVLVERVRRSGKIRRSIPWTASTTLVLLLLCAPFSDLVGRRFFDLAAVLVGFPVIVAMSLKETDDTNLFANFLGNISYPIYVLHTPILAIFTVVISKMKGYWFSSEVYSGVLFMIIVMVIGVLTTSYYDVPVRRWLSRKVRSR